MDGRNVRSPTPPPTGTETIDTATRASARGRSERERPADPTDDGPGYDADAAQAKGDEQEGLGGDVESAEHVEEGGHRGRGQDRAERDPADRETPVPKGLASTGATG